MTHPTDDSLKPCPFCGAGTTEITPKGRMWTGMKYSEPSSVSVRHWCEAVPGQPSRMIERVGRDEASAIDAWNTRALLAEQARTEPTNLIGWIYEDSLPDAYPYHAMFPHSAVIDGVRMFPVYAPAPPLKAEQAKDAGEDAKFMDAFKSGQAIRVDWPMEPSTPEEALELLDMMDVEYAKTMGKSAPDAEMGNSMRRVRHMACDLWAWKKETMRESFNEAIRAARAAERKEQ